jgi:hypothetical protein
VPIRSARQMPLLVVSNSRIVAKLQSPTSAVLSNTSASTAPGTVSMSCFREGETSCARRRSLPNQPKVRKAFPGASCLPRHAKLASPRYLEVGTLGSHYVLRTKRLEQGDPLDHSGWSTLRVFVVRKATRTLNPASEVSAKRRHEVLRCRVASTYLGTR